MALDLDSAINVFGSLSISQDALLFNPSKDQNSIRRGLHDVPPYLFRVHTPKSAGTLDEEWARSEDAKAALTDPTRRESSETDILQRRDFNHVAKDISAHLWWKWRVPATTILSRGQARFFWPCGTATTGNRQSQACASTRSNSA
ncbi:hypothetical protein ACKVV1_001520 [Pyricularia oryzae]